MPESNNQIKSKDDRRAAIMQAAYKLFGQVGFAKTTMKDIAAEAGVAQGLIGYHFGTKEALLVAVIREWMINRGMKEAFSRLDLNEEPERLLSNALKHISEFRRVNSGWFTLLISLWLESRRNKELLEELNEIYREMRNGVLEVIERLQLPLSTEQKEQLSLVVQALFDGLTLQSTQLEPLNQDYYEQITVGIQWLVKGTMNTGS